MKPEEVRSYSVKVDKSCTTKILSQPRAALMPPPPEKAQAEIIKEKARKLGLWYTRNFRPITTHNELDIVMSTLGFVALPPYPGPKGVLWKEYAHSNAGAGGRRPRLPYPRVDGMHMLTYAMFLECVNFYVRMDNVADIFHVRSMPLNGVHDRNEEWARMEEDENSVYLYRCGTLDQPAHSFSIMNYQNDILFKDDNASFDSVFIHKQGTSTTTSLSVPIKDIIVKPVPAPGSSANNIKDQDK